MEFVFLPLATELADKLGLPAERGIPVDADEARRPARPFDLPELARQIERYRRHVPQDVSYDLFLTRYHHHAGARLANEGRLPEALVHLEQAHGIAPDDEAVVEDLARAAFELRHFDRARELYGGQVARGRATLEAHEALARMAMAVGDRAAAVAAAEAARRSFPDSWESANLLTTIYYHARDIARLEASLHAQLELDPSNVLTLEKLAVYYRECARHSEARTAIERAIRLDAGNARLRYQSAMIHFAMGVFAAAETDFRTALLLEEEHLDSLNGLGLLLAEMSRSDEARATLLRVVEKAPRDYRGPLNLGRILLRPGGAEGGEALEWFRKALDLGMDDPGALKRVYIAARDLGDEELAQRADRLLARTTGRAAAVSGELSREATTEG